MLWDSKSDRVWVTGNGGNAIYALDPKTEKFTTFRMPPYLSYGRRVTIDYSNGDVWTALASYPNKLSLRDHSLLVRIHHARDCIAEYFNASKISSARCQSSSESMSTTRQLGMGKPSPAVCIFLRSSQAEALPQ